MNGGDLGKSKPAAFASHGLSSALFDFSLIAFADSTCIDCDTCRWMAPVISSTRCLMLCACFCLRVIEIHGLLSGSPAVGLPNLASIKLWVV